MPGRVVVAQWVAGSYSSGSAGRSARRSAGLPATGVASAPRRKAPAGGRCRWGMTRFVLPLFLLLVLAAPASAMVKLPEIPTPVSGNPADKLLSVPIEATVYDPATHCTPKAARPGIAAMTRWLAANVRGVSWGSYRCEKWGKHEASLHAENRAID